MEASESVFCLQLCFGYDSSGPLVQHYPQTTQFTDVTKSLDVVFSSEKQTDRFTGKPVSQTTGLYYEYQRWYDPSVGRFISHDSLPGFASDPQSLNPYVYVLNRPTSLVDPTGMCVGGSEAGDYLCTGGESAGDSSGNSVFPDASHWDYDKINSEVSDPRIQQDCMDNPGLCGDFLKSRGYNPDDFVARDIGPPVSADGSVGSLEPSISTLNTESGTATPKIDANLGADAGQVSGLSSSGRTVVIGENMGRVTEFANNNGYGYFEANSPRSQWVKENMAWLSS